MKSPVIKTFTDIQDNDLQEIGGKAYSLSKLTKLGYSVPTGFVITSSTFHQFLQDNGIHDEISQLMSNLKQNTADLGRTSEKISQLIMTGAIDNQIIDTIKAKAIELGGVSFAFRSSSASEDGIEHSWAGQMTTILGVTPNDLDKTIKTCWSSFFSPQALSYRATNMLPFEIGHNAIIVQRMIKSDYSGVAFSIDPRGGNDKSIIIEAVCGLGEALVSGKIMPVRYIFHKESFELLEYSHTSQKMSYILDDCGKAKWVESDSANNNDLGCDTIRELLSDINSLEKEWGRHVDVEWAVENNKLHLLQCRPVTNIDKL